MALRCLHVVPTYFPAVRYGGPIHSVHGLCRALAARGCDVHVYTTNVDGAGVSSVPLEGPVELDGVNVHYFPTATGRRIYRSPAMGAALTATVASFDVVHIHSVFLWPTAIAARLARRHRIPYVLAPRGMLVDSLIRRKSRFLKSAWLWAFERSNIAGAAAIHATSEMERRDIEKLGFDVRSFAVVPNGIDAIPAGAAKPVMLPSRPYVLCLGRVNWKKGIERLIAAMSHVPRANLVIAGNDEDGEAARLMGMVHELGLEDRVRFIGPVYGDEKWALIRNCTTLALASHSENFGNVVLEAMACSRPVVVTTKVGLADIVAQSGSGLVVDGSPTAIGNAISALITDPAYAQRLGEVAAKTARDLFSWPAVASTMCGVYETVVTASGKEVGHA